MNIFFVSLGCDKNLTDSETMLGLLDRAGYRVTDEPDDADYIIVNSCCFIGDAKEESIDTILEMASYKESGKCRGLIVCGCLAQRYSEEIKTELPEVDAIVGTTSYDKIVEVIDELSGRSNADNNLSGDISGLDMQDENERLNPVCVLDDRDRLPDKKPGLLTTGGHFAYLKIAEGCNRRCTYCVIPSVRGDYRSYPIEDLYDEAVRLAEGGVKELILVAQETCLYGTDLYGVKSLPKLLNKLSQIEGLKWIRIMYCYPEEIDAELVEAIKRNPKVLHYLDMPIQHASDKILRRMGRAVTGEQIREKIRLLRSSIPDITLRTTIITGFPGEDEEDMDTLLGFIDDCEFDRLGVFTYSREEGTPAADFDSQIDEDVKLERKNDVMVLQAEISRDINKRLTGTVTEAFIQGEIPDEGVYVGRTYRDAPDVDGLVFITSDKKLFSGDLVKIRITGAKEYDLTGELYEPTE
ncbi:MAG: 30S ribosomal protein S12 methylthiotransferase RimO [Lachnospiraceae bacterium]|nr:30S ribosomal protein S12 methylthiotransferase RimO [Lachnospiraceae bacterium]